VGAGDRGHVVEPGRPYGIHMTPEGADIR
jgi:hypothetical protein